MYVVEYDTWYLGMDKELWNRVTEYRYHDSLRAAEAMAEQARWDEDIIEDSVMIRLMTDNERKIYYGN